MTNAKPSFVRRLAWVAAEVVVAMYIVADSLASLLFRPVMRFLSSLQVIQRLERAIDALPAYVILVLLVVPFIVAEFAKAFAIFWMSQGHMHSGMTIFISAYVVSILGCERMLHAGKRKLMTIAWFGKTYTWLMALREQVLSRLSETLIWQVAVDMRAKALRLVRRLAIRFRSASGMKPRSALGRR